jgi:hypothetical protein
MRNLFLVLCALCLSASVAAAQSKIDSQWNCSKPSDAHSIDVGDHAGHTYAVAKFTCTAAKGEIEGLQEKEGTGTEFEEIKGNSLHGHGVFVETVSNGDKLFVSYQPMATFKDGQMESAGNTWVITDGTGKFKGIKGKGGCKGKANADGTSTYDCSGEYTLGTM